MSRRSITINGMLITRLIAGTAPFYSAFLQLLPAWTAWRGTRAKFSDQAQPAGNRTRQPLNSYALCSGKEIKHGDYRYRQTQP